MGRRKKKKETAEKRFNRVTKDYEECKKRNIWKIERKVADELLLAAKKLDLELKLDRLSEFRYNSFPLSILLQLRRKDVYDNLDDDIKDLADKMDHYLLRRKVVDFIQKVDHPEVEKFKEEFKAKSKENNWKIEIEENFIGSGSSNDYGDEDDEQDEEEEEDEDEEKKEQRAKTNWENFWQLELRDRCSSYMFKQATAWYLKLDIKIVAIEDDDDPYDTYVFNGLFEANTDEEAYSRNKKIGCLYVGYKTDMQHQSLIPMDQIQKDQEKENLKESVSQIPGSNAPRNQRQSLIECPNCKYKFFSLLKHIAARGSKCKGKVDEELLNSMRKEAKTRNKEMNKIHKAQSRKKKQEKETFGKRKDRIALQSYYMQKYRTRKREDDYELTLQIARESKAKSRIKQTQFDPLYERVTDQKRQ